MSFLIIHSDGVQESFLSQPGSIPSDALYSGNPANVPNELKPTPTPQADWAGYLISMIGNTLWQQWVDALPSHHALSTTGAAQRENAAMLQISFDNAAAAVAPPTGARAAWQAIADANNIAVDFEGS